MPNKVSPDPGASSSAKSLEDNEGGGMPAFPVAANGGMQAFPVAEGFSQKGKGGAMLTVPRNQMEAGVALPLPQHVQAYPNASPIASFPQARVEGVDWKQAESVDEIAVLKANMKADALEAAFGIANRGGGGMTNGKAGIQHPLIDKDKQATAPVRVQFKGKVFVTDQALVQAFNAFDLDGNGFISAAEIRELARYIGEDLTDEELDEMIIIMEHNGDGQVSIDEFVPEIKNIACDAGYLLWGSEASTEPGGSIHTNIVADGILPHHERKKVEVIKKKKPMSKGTKGMSTDKERTLTQFATRNEFSEAKLDKVVKKLKKMDKNFNGKLDYTMFCKILECPDGAHAKALFSNFDDDGNGSVDVRELMVGLASFTLSARDDKIKFAFMMYDLDGSGDLSKDELEAMIRANHFTKTSSIKNKMAAILSQCDKDGDGFISYEEFVNFARKFPNLVFPAYAVADKMNSKFGVVKAD